MINTKIEVSNLKYLDEIIKKTQLATKESTNFLKFLEPKFIEIAKKVTSQRYVETTNDDYYTLYYNNHKTSISGNTLILSNTTVIPKEELNIRNPKGKENYPNGFSISIAFEYGTGVGGSNPNAKKKWFYYINETETAETSGYKGMEIYRFIGEEIKKQMPNLIEEFYKKGK